MDEQKEKTATLTPPPATSDAPSDSEIIASFTEQPIVSEPAPKKSKKLLIIAASVAGVLLLGFGGFFGYRYFSAKHQPAEAETPVVQTDKESLAPAKLEASKLSLVGNSLNDFDLALLKLENKAENKVYSPLSIKYALAMLKDGANGNSAAQLEALIGSYSPKSYINSSHRSLANAMYIREDFRSKVNDSYISTLKSKYNATVQLDPFTSPTPINSWISDQTLGIINDMLDESAVNTELDYLLINALAIDMNWENQLQCGPRPQLDDGKYLPCKLYSVRYAHEDYSDGLNKTEIFDASEFDQITFNGKEGVFAAELGASINRYDIFKELGEDYIRSTVSATYDQWLEETKNSEDYQAHPDWYELDFDLETYISELKENLGQLKTSTDFLWNETESEKVFAKDLREYDGATLQYVAFMPKSGSLASYVSSLDAARATELISSLKNAESLTAYKDGVVTKLTAHIPFFQFAYEVNLIPDLISLGVTDVFSTADADLSGMLNDIDFSSESRPYIDIAIHKADIDFSNDGIKAAAVTAVGGRGAAGSIHFDYLWDIPVEEIDLTFDHPFVFFIRDKATGEVWFTGTVYEP